MADRLSIGIKENRKMIVKIQHRRGAYAYYDPTKVLPGEMVVVQSDDPNSEDGKAIYIGTTAGDVKRLVTENELESEVATGLARLVREEVETIAQAAIADIEQDVEDASVSASSASNYASQAANSMNIADQAANAAFEQAQTATTKANEASASAQEAAQSATNASSSATAASTSAGQAASSATAASGSATAASGSATEARAAAATATEAAETAQGVADSIPADYSQMSADVDTLKADTTALKEDLTYKTNNVYGGATTVSYLVGTAGKTWHSTLGTLVNNTKRAASEQIKFMPDMQKFDVPSSYRMIVYGNNDSIGHALTQVSSLGVVTYSLASFPYKYIYIVIFKSDQSDIESDLTNVLSISTYDDALPFALEQDLDQIETDIDNIGTAIRNVESDTGIYHINLFADNLVNMSVSATTGEPMGINNARCCNSKLLPLAPNVPLYINHATGFFNPILHLFNNGIFTGTVVRNFVNGNSYNADGIRFLFFKNPNTADISAQDVVDNFSIYQERTTSYNKRIYNLEHADEETNDYSLIAYGDSLTTGAGATSSNNTYWAVCASQLSMKNRIGFGFGGSKSKAIAFTAGALSAYIPPNANTFKIKYADLESNLTIAANALNGKTVIVNGAEYTISQTSPTDFSLPDTYIPSNIYLPVVNKNSRYTADVYIIWVGTNDNGMQWDLIDAMIAKLPHKKYVVMGLTRFGTDTSPEDEEKAYKLYGSHYFNTRKQILNNAFALLGTTPTAEDETAMSNGLMPPSLLVDSTHFNDSGYEVIGKLLAMHIKSLGYTFQIA